jgi:hypothetical protein
LKKMRGGEVGEVGEAVLAGGGWVGATGGLTTEAVEAFVLKL